MKMTICGSQPLRFGKCEANNKNLNPSSFKPGLTVPQRVGLTSLAENIHMAVGKLRCDMEGAPKRKDGHWEPPLVRPGLAVVQRARLTNLAENKRSNRKLRSI